MNFKVCQFKDKDDSNAIYNDHLTRGIKPPYFSRDYHKNSKGSKLYFIIDTSCYQNMTSEYVLTNKIEIQKIMWDTMIDHIINDKRNPHYYEMTPEGGVHIFVDIDGKAPLQLMLDHCNNDIEQWTSKLNKYVIQRIVSILNLESDHGIRALVTDSSNKDKFSRHVIYKLPNGQWFDNTQWVGSIIHEIKNQWPEDKTLSIPELKDDGSIEYIFPFDMQVYAITKSRCFRAIRSSKGEPSSMYRFKLPVIDNNKVQFNNINKNMMLDYMITYNDSMNQAFISIKEQLLANYIAFGRLKSTSKKRPSETIINSFGDRKIQKLSDTKIIVNRTLSNDLRTIMPEENINLLEQPNDIINSVLTLLNDKGLHWYDPVQGIVCVGDSRHDCEILAGCNTDTNINSLEQRKTYNHKSNHIYWIVKLGSTGYIVQKCHDNNCSHKSGQKIYFKNMKTNSNVEKIIKYQRPNFNISTDYLFS